MLEIPDVVFFVMGVAGLLLLAAIYFRLKSDPKKKKRPRGMSLEELGYRRSRYLYHARHYQKGYQTKDITNRN